MICLLWSEVVVTLELDRLLLVYIVDEHEDALVAKPRKLDGFLEKATATLDKGVVSLLFVLHLVRPVECTFDYWAHRFHL